MVAEQSEELLPTRASLLARLKESSADDSWREFFDLYWKLIYNTARRHGLPEYEAQDLVQEIMIKLTGTLKKFEYQPQKGSFKAWLRREIYWRVTDNLRRYKQCEPLEAVTEFPAQSEFDEFWESEWKANLVNVAIERAKLKVRPLQFQIYSYCVLQEHGPQKTGLTFNLSAPRIYLNNHRVSRAIEAELKKLYFKD